MSLNPHDLALSSMSTLLTKSVPEHCAVVKRARCLRRGSP